MNASSLKIGDDCVGLGNFVLGRTLLVVLVCWILVVGLCAHLM